MATMLRQFSNHPVRLGFLGLGWIGRQRLQAVAAAEGVEISAIADADATVLQRAAADFPDAEQVPSLHAMLERDLDGLVIATPNALHADQTIAALDRGLAVFCQKPLAPTAEATRRVVAAARAADRLLAVDYSYRCVRGMETLRDRLREGRLGDIFAIDLTFHNAYGPDKPWCADRRTAGGGCVLDLGIHLIDLASWLQDFPGVRNIRSRLYARGCRLSPGDEALEDLATAEIEFASGAHARLACSWQLPIGRPAVIEATLYGTRGGASWRNVGGSFYDFVVEQYNGAACETIAGPPDAWGGRALCRWARLLAHDPSFDAGSTQYLRVAEIVDAIYGRPADADS
ncbi:Gfo/Idh/MocA family oxidoreductase [soil metagenome]